MIRNGFKQPTKWIQIRNGCIILHDAVATVDSQLIYDGFAIRSSQSIHDGFAMCLQFMVASQWIYDGSGIHPQWVYGEFAMDLRWVRNGSMIDSQWFYG